MGFRTQEHIDTIINNMDFNRSPNGIKLREK